MSKHELREQHRMERKEAREKEQEHAKQKQSFKKIGMVSAVVVIVVIVAFTALRMCSGPGKYDEFAQCLSEEGVIMAGTDWCSVCKALKGLFGESFEHVYYMNCDLNERWCMSNGVEHYPTWFIGNTTHTGKQSLSMLAELSGCVL